MPSARPSEQVAEQAQPQPWTVHIPRLMATCAFLVLIMLVVFARHDSLPLWQPLTLAAVAFLCEFVDSSLGMGYGTTFTPLLLLVGFDLKTVVPVILLSEFFTGLTAGGFHHALGNASFKWKSRDANVALVLGLAGIFGALVAVQFLTSVPRFWARLYFALMITGMGVVILYNRNRSYRFSWGKIGGLGLISSFNKGMSGGGYGPLVVGGQLLSGCNPRNAVACTSLAESLVCLVGLIGFALKGVFPTPVLAVPIVAGAMLSAPLASVTTRYLSTKTDLKVIVGVLVVILGLLCLTKVPGS